MKTTFPAAFLRALPPLAIKVKLESRDGAPYLISEPQTLVLGAELDRPGTDPLPEDSKVIDQDKDGHPGMTVVVSGLVSGEVYVVQRSTVRLSGPKTRSGFSGGVHFELEQHVVGASKAVLRSGPDPRADSSRSYFRLVKLSGSAKCDDALRVLSDRR